ncbi:hypothetical protein C663_2873 [Bacillus subtilis XF-1]|nr:hypothetical protein C663_2873 [Bacillus subtilis XF-1]EHA30767.1 hypothetical protein BSSC8_12100 [Bacillus subtilis subsp. subtilis str. SC-8]
MVNVFFAVSAELFSAEHPGRTSRIRERNKTKVCFIFSSLSS